MLRRVQRVGRQRVVIQPPDHHAEGSQIIRAGRPAVAHFPDFITQSGLIKRVRVVGDRNFRRAELGVGRVGVHQQRRLRRHGDKAEPSAVVVVRRYVARLVRRNDEKLVSRFGQKIVQLHLVRGLQNGVRQRERKIAVGAVTNHRRRRLVRRPGDDRFAELVGFRNVRHRRRHEVNNRGGGVAGGRRGVLINRFDGVAVRHLQTPVGHRGAGHNREVVGERAERTRGHQRHRFAVRLSGTGHQDSDRRLARQIGIDQFHLDHIRRTVGGAIEEHNTDTRRRQIAGNHERKILVNGRRVHPRVFDDIPRDDSHDVFAGRRRLQMHGLDVVDLVAARRVGHRLAVDKLVAAINASVRRNHFEVEVVDQRRNRAGEPRHVGVSQRDFERLVRTGDHDALLVRLAGRQQIGLIDKLISPRRADNLRQVNATPAFVHVRHRPFSSARLQSDCRIDERGLDQGGRWRGAPVGLTIILHEHRRCPRNVRTRLARAALVLVVIVDGQPRVFVRRRLRLQRRDPSARRDHIRLEAAVFARAAARKIRHRVFPVGINEKVEPIIFRRTGGDDVFARRGAVKGLRAGTGVAGGKLKNVRLVAGRFGIGITNERIEFVGAEVITSLHVVAPTVGADHRAGPDRIPRQRLFIGRQLIVAHRVEDALHDDVGAGRDA